MKNTKIQKLKKEPIVEVLEEEFYLPKTLKKEINTYWDKLVAENPRYTRGKIFCVKEIVRKGNTVKIFLTYSDYAHYMYARHHTLEEAYRCRNCWAATLIETKDDKYIVGKMNEGTSTPNILQLSGGNIDKDEIENHIVNMRNCAKRELKEETNLDMDKRIQEIQNQYISYEIDKNSVGVIYKIKLQQTAEEIMQQYKDYKAYLETNDLEIEFSELVAIDKKQVRNFFENTTIPWEDTIYPLLLEDSKEER